VNGPVQGTVRGDPMKGYQAGVDGGNVVKKKEGVSPWKSWLKRDSSHLLDKMKCSAHGRGKGDE